MRGWWLALALGGAPQVEAHPLSRDTWSLRTAVRLSDASLDVVLVVEIPFDEVREAIVAAQAEQPEASPKAIMASYGERTLSRMAEQASLRIDGAPAPGRFVPKDHPMNGRGSASGGFFTWIVEYRQSEPTAWGETLTVEVRHDAFTSKPIVFSTFAVAGAGWRKTEDSAHEVLPKGPYKVDDPAFWSKDPRLRTARVVFSRDER